MSLLALKPEIFKPREQKVAEWVMRWSSRLTEQCLSPISVPCDFHTATLNHAIVVVMVMVMEVVVVVVAAAAVVVVVVVV